MARSRARWASPSTKITPNQLREEGVIEVGNAGGVLFVLTRRKLHLIHNSINSEDRRLDDYAIQLAVNWIESGHRSYEVASNLDVSPQHLQLSLEAAGYERLVATEQERHWKVGMKQKLGNRRGKLVSKATKDPAARETLTEADRLRSEQPSVRAPGWRIRAGRYGEAAAARRERAAG